MNNKFKKALRMFVAFAICFVLSSSTVFAAEIEKLDEEVTTLEKVEMTATTEETWVYLPEFTSAKYYCSINYTQSQNGNNCGPTAAANILSYFKTVKGYNLYTGDVDQSIYDQICSDCNYANSGGTSPYNVSNGIKVFANRAGYSCDINIYWLNLFSDVKRDINNGYPVLMAGNGHMYVILGYSEGGPDGDCIYTCTGWENPKFEWYKFNSTYTMGSINIYK